MINFWWSLQNFFLLFPFSRFFAVKDPHSDDDDSDEMEGEEHKQLFPFKL